MIRSLALVLALSAAITVAGCTATSTGTSGYGASAAVQARTAAAGAKSRAEARRLVRKEKQALAKATARAKALKTRVARDRKRLRTKLTSKRKSRIAARLKRNETALTVALRTARTERRDLRRAERRAARAERIVSRAKRLEARAKRLEARRASRVSRAEARREEKRLALLERRGRAASADGTAGRRRTASWLGRVSGGLGRVSGGLVGARRDPALRYAADYRARTDGGWALPAIPIAEMPKRLLRQEVRYPTAYKPGTIVVDTGARYLYLVQRGGRAMRYGIGVGRQGFEWRGAAHIGWKQAWPKWTPPEEMIERQPELAKYCADCGGMPGGLSNPLGARALYLHANGKDTLYRLHGTPDWRSIGTAASSGCIRMINQDVIDLYERARTGAKVVVM